TVQKNFTNKTEDQSLLLLEYNIKNNQNNKKPLSNKWLFLGKKNHVIENTWLIFKKNLKQLKQTISS
ncbi:MAG: hypothetical protein O9267_04445, partial [Flavobacterium sp.]|uniref:hypothetical protein n=1 Tax=Flavobacterium sp. TaxID=239 RepID=UPI0022C7C21F